MKIIVPTGGATIRGCLTYDGKPVVGQIIFDTFASACSDVNGNYEIKDIPEGSYEMSAFYGGCFYAISKKEIELLPRNKKERK